MKLVSDVFWWSYQFSHIRQVEICRKKLIVDGDDKVESLLNTDNMSSNMLSCLK